MTGKRVDPLAQTDISEPGRGAAHTPQPAPDPGSTVVSMVPSARPVALPTTPAAARPAGPGTRPWMLALAVLAGAATAFGLAYALH